MTEPGAGWRSTYLHRVEKGKNIMAGKSFDKKLTDLGEDGWQCTALAIGADGQYLAVFTKHKWIVPERGEEK